MLWVWFNAVKQMKIRSLPGLIIGGSAALWGLGTLILVLLKPSGTIELGDWYYSPSLHNILIIASVAAFIGGGILFLWSIWPRESSS